MRAISFNDNANGGSLGPLNGKDKALSRGCGPLKAPRPTGAPSAEALRKHLPIRTAFPAIWHSFDNPVTPAASSDRRPQERPRKISRLLIICISAPYRRMLLGPHKSQDPSRGRSLIRRVRTPKPSRFPTTYATM